MQTLEYSLRLYGSHEQPRDHHSVHGAFLHLCAGLGGCFDKLFPHIPRVALSASCQAPSEPAATAGSTVCSTVSTSSSRPMTCVHGIHHHRRHAARRPHPPTSRVHVLPWDPRLRGGLLHRGEFSEEEIKEASPFPCRNSARTLIRSVLLACDQWSPAGEGLMFHNKFSR